MKKLILVSLILLFAIPAIAGQYKVLRIVDGDTIDILYQGKKERIRMLNVDTPESVHPDQSRNTAMGKKASNYTKKRLAGRSVDLEFQAKKRGRYGRLLAYVVLDRKNFNIELVKKGWSPYYTKYGTSSKHHADFRSAQRYAKSKKLNIWSAPGAYARPKTRTYAKPKKTVISNRTGVYHGNTSSHKFHQPGCRYYDCSKCTKVFQSRDEAVAAGYLPCGACRP